MAHRNDRPLGVPQGVADEHRSKAAVALAMVAGHLATRDPQRALNALDFAVLVGVKVYDVGGRSRAGDGVDISHLVLEAVGEVPAGVSRVEFAVPVAKAAQALGYDWTADDNRRVIPTIPAPRREQLAGVGR
ncbi:hypothetical protein ACFVH9_08500 [Streptomyces hirsutus]|uniref:hypothetical protein n=1 Tax=Streptomyces hirsutus TaxID=35620 RepID=UPI003630AA70